MGRYCQVVWRHGVCYTGFMISPDTLPALKGYRFPRSIIGYAVWACHRFAMSLRDV